MPVKTNRELVTALCDIVNNHNTLYVMGCFGAPLTGANVTRYISNHNYNKQAARVAMIKAAANKTTPVFGFDCVCLIKGVLWGWNGDPSKPHGGAIYASSGVPDINANAMIRQCKGLSTNFSKIEVGEAVWLDGHIGIYIGDGRAIECTPSWTNNVQITAVKNIGPIPGLNARQWMRHGKLPYITYEGGTISLTVTMQPAQPSAPAPAFNVGDIVNFTGSRHYSISRAVNGPTCKPGIAKITQIAQGAIHLYHLIAEKGGGSNVYGWVNATDVHRTARVSATDAPVSAGDNIALAVKHATHIIFANEGGEGSVNKNDNGALSIGKAQWHGPRALALMKTIIEKDTAQAQSILDDALYNEIQGAKADTWNKRTLNAGEASKISALLITPVGVTAQNALAEADITAYVKKGQSYGLTDVGALIYFADGVNQYGTNSTRWKTIAENALKTTGDVTAMFNATAVAVDNKYIARRERVYKAVLALQL
ncbi:MAG: hypothetical protein LBL05_05180 [Synergistaceae bacterium]|jgi:hypothetical protein|nr:hypothetical protein [Synergistaceae bacterium]